MHIDRTKLDAAVEIAAKYKNLDLGYDDALDQLIRLGLSEVEADDMLVPRIRRNK